nr:hypothetical protein BaRGS_021536 [Batillaria attramentaria]
MKEELKTRTGLRLVLPDLKHDVLPVKKSPFLATLALCRNTLVVFDDYDTLDGMHENALQQAVKEAEHPDGRTVFIQRGMLCPDWVLNKLGTSTLMIYPHDAGRQLNRGADFWTTVAAYLDDPQRGVHVVYDADSSNFVLTELKQEVEKRTKLTLILPDMNHNALSEQEDQLDVEHNTLSRGVHVVYDADSSNFVLTELKQEVEKRTKLTLILPDVNHNPLSEQEDQLDVEHNTLSVKGNGSDFVLIELKQEVEKRTKLTLILPDVNHNALSEQEDQLDVEHNTLSQGVHVVYDADSSDFVLTELKDEMEKRAGLRLELPDMEHKALSEQGNQPENILTIQGNEFCAILALYEDSQVDIHTAVCTDVDRVRQVLRLSEDECVSSPVAEYWAGHEFRFKKPVTITLPHFLPPDPDPSLVHVYRDSADQQTAEISAHVWDGRIRIADFRQVRIRDVIFATYY